MSWLVILGIFLVLLVFSGRNGLKDAEKPRLPALTETEAVEIENGLSEQGIYRGDDDWKPEFEQASIRLRMSKAREALS